MNPLTTLELATCTLAELIVLAKVIESMLAKDDEAPDERQATFVNREMVRRALSQRGAQR